MPTPDDLSKRGTTTKSTYVGRVHEFAVNLFLNLTLMGVAKGRPHFEFFVNIRLHDGYVKR